MSSPDISPGGRKRAVFCGIRHLWRKRQSHPKETAPSLRSVPKRALVGGEHFRRRVVARFDGGAITSDAGALLLRETDRRIALLGRFAACFEERRDPHRIEHRVGELVSQRVYALALGYEDLNDHDQLRSDPLLALLAGKVDVEPAGAQQRRPPPLPEGSLRYGGAGPPAGGRIRGSARRGAARNRVGLGRHPYAHRVGAAITASRLS